MTLHKETAGAIYQQTDSAEYGRYEGTQIGGTSHQHHEMTYEQHENERPLGKVYPPARDHTNVLRFSLTLIALGLILLFGLLFVVIIGGTTGWASFAVACIAVLFVAGIGITSVK